MAITNFSNVSGVIIKQPVITHFNTIDICLLLLIIITIIFVTTYYINTYFIHRRKQRRLNANK